MLSKPKTIQNDILREMSPPPLSPLLLLPYCPPTSLLSGFIVLVCVFWFEFFFCNDKKTCIFSYFHFIMKILAF